MPYTILIADDSAVMRKILERRLRQTRIVIAGVIEAGDGVEAWQRLQEEGGIQVIFSDVNLPKMDGLEFLKQVKQSERHRELPVVMVATEGSESKVLQALALGAAGYLRKPFTAAQMEHALQKLLA